MAWFVLWRLQKRGGILSLGRFIVEHWESLEADFDRYYDTELSEACFSAGSKSIRWLRARIRYLPAESATVHELNHGDDDELPDKLTTDEIAARYSNVFSFPGS